MGHLAKRIKRVKPSATLAVSAKAKALKAEGKDIVDLSTGEPDFDTPQHIKDAAVKALDEGFTKYTAVDGIADLKNAIIKKFQEDNGLTYAANQVIVSVGEKQSLYNLFQAVLNPGDEIIIPAPYWVSFPDMALLAEAEPVTINTLSRNHFKMVPEELEAAITSKTKLVVINSPSNPTGSTYTKKELKAIGKVLLKHPRILIATDDIYEKLLYTEEPYMTIAQVIPELYNRTITLNGVSKSHSMTGWRIGYAAGPAEIIKAMKTLQSQSTSNPTSIAQVAAVAALNGSQQCITDMVKVFVKRRDMVVKSLNTMNGIECISPTGSFYAFPKMGDLVGKKSPAGKVIKNSTDFASYLLEEHFVAVVPGIAFGKENYFRISFATSDENLNAAMERIGKACDNLS